MKKYRKIIKIGNSKGVTLPANDFDLKDIEYGDWVEITVKKVR